MKNKISLHRWYKDLPVLVTGGAGFIGSHLVAELVALEATVTVLDNFKTGLEENLACVADKITCIKGDITDYATCLRATEKMAIIFHLAAEVSVPESFQNPLLYHAVNVTGTLNLLEAARINKVDRLILSSSSAVYGEQQGICSEATPTNPQSPYGTSKLLAEYYCTNYAQAYGVSTVALRYFNVYGARQRADLPAAGVVATLRKKMAQNEPITLFGDGMQQRDFVPVEQVVQANLACGASTMAWQGECFNVATGSSRTLLSLVEELRAEFPAYTHEIGFADARPGDIYYSAADCSKFKRFFEPGA